MNDSEVVYFLNTLRAALRLDPLPTEGRLQLFRFSLDGLRDLTAHEWASELGISRTTAIFRSARLATDLLAHKPDAYALALAPNYRKPQRKSDQVQDNRRANRRATRKGRAAGSHPAGAEG